MTAAERLAELHPAERRIAEATSDDFAALLRIASLDPGRDLRFANWSGIDFSGADLRGFDFTGARLDGCRFDGARIAGARFEMASVERAALRRARDWDAHVRGWRRPDRPPSGRHLRDLAVFSDAPFAPEMVVIPAGAFQMGATEEEHRRFVVIGEWALSERPRHTVMITERFALARTPVTFADFDRFCRATKRKRPADEGWGRGDRPAVNIRWQDATAWCAWMSKQTGADYRLPSEAEWEYAARAGSVTAFPWGNDWDPSKANGDRTVKATSKVGSYPPNDFGLADMIGNVWEWCADTWEDHYRTPRTQRPYVLADDGRRVLRGGSSGNFPRDCRAAFRYRLEPGRRHDHTGFRPARTLTP